MANRFHLGTRGPSPCAAVKGNCPFGGESGSENHFHTLTEAAAAYETSMGSSLSAPLQKDGLDDSLDVDKLIMEAADEDISRGRLGILAKNEDPAVRRVVASSPKASVSLLRRLAKDSDEEVRAAVASNENTDEVNLAELLSDKSSLVASSAAGNAGTPRTALAKVDVESSLTLAMAVASNNSGKVNVRTFKKLVKLDDNEVLNRLAANGAAPDAVVTDAVVGVRQATTLMESHPNPPASAVEAAWKVHTADGRVPNADLYLSHDSTPDHIRNEILKNSEMTEQTVGELAVAS